MIALRDEYDRGPRYRARARGTTTGTFVVIFLIVASVSIKLALYAGNFFEPRVLGPPLPTSQTSNDDHTGDAGQPGASKSLPVQANDMALWHNTSDYIPRQRLTLQPWLTFKTESFTAPNITFNRTGNATPGMYFCGALAQNSSHAAPMILDESGGLVWHGPPGLSTNVKVQDVHGEPYLMFWKSHRAKMYGHEYGEVDVLNSSYDRVYRVCPGDMNIETHEGYECNLDMHAATMTDRGTLLATAYNTTLADLTSVGGDVDAWVFDSQFYEIDIETQEVLFQWSSMAHLSELPFSASRFPLPGFPKSETEGDEAKERSLGWDYFHINMVTPLDDGYLISSRALWSVIKINQAGNVDWILDGETGGDFTLESNTFFSWQHDARVIDRYGDTLQVTMFNNDYSGVSDYVNGSHGLVLAVDLELRRARTIRVQADADDRIFAAAMGSSQLLPDGHVLLNYGYGATFKEFDSDDRLVLSANFGLGSSQSFSATYSLFKYENWHAEPRTPPKAVAEYDAEANNTTVWMSWNGATDHDFWVVYTGHESSSLVRAGAFARAGFETEAVLEGEHSWVLVEAMQEGSARRNSSVFETIFPPVINDGR